MNLKSWIVTARLRTLPLSLSAVAGGIMVDGLYSFNSSAVTDSFQFCQ